MNDGPTVMNRLQIETNDIMPILILVSYNVLKWLFKIIANLTQQRFLIMLIVDIYVDVSNMRVQ